MLSVVCAENVQVNTPLLLSFASLAPSIYLSLPRSLHVIRVNELTVC